jgi:multiple sugar transport system substrate-binding protein
MTWENAIELGKKLSRTENGIKYRGLEPENANRISLPLSAQTVDPITEKSLLIR